MSQHTEKPELLVRLGEQLPDRESAIREAARILAEAGCVPPEYVDSMLKREQTADTFLGAGVAIPHGSLEDKGQVKHDGLVVLQVPEGLEWSEGRRARLIVGIAAASDGHIAILRRLAGLIQEPERIEKLSSTTNPDDIRAALLGENVTATAPAKPTEADDLTQKIEWTLDYPSGLHARPAMQWAAAAKAAGLPMRVRHENGLADPRNLVALLQLGMRAGDRLVISAEGPNAVEALAEFRKVIAGLSAQEKAAARLDSERAASRAAAAGGWTPPPGLPDSFKPVQGVSGAPGLAVGKVRRLDTAPLEIKDVPVGLLKGGKMLEDAITETRHQMKALIDDTTRRLGAADAAIFKAQAALLEDEELIAETSRQMVEGHGPAWSWNRAIETAAGLLGSLGNAVLAGRAADLRDVGRRVLMQLDPALKKTAQSGLAQVQPEEPVVIIASDLSPSDTAGLDPDKTVGFATVLGGPTAHTAILARTLGIAAVVAAGEDLLQAREGDTVIVDGDGGRVWFNPPEEALAEARRQINEQREKRAAQAAERGLPAQTTDGARLEVAANINRPDQVPGALDQGAESVGLMRTEFLFLERGDTPDEDEQYATYSAMSKALGPRPLIIRALDIGGDKQVPHLELPREDNPFLGVRGARLLLRRPELLLPQLRAIYRAAKDSGGDSAKISIMFPMITSEAEVQELRAQCEAVRAELGAPQLPLGIMVEVPAAAVSADTLAAQVDFFSIGTNDLTQYTLAMDRQNPELAAEADSLHPAVLRLVRLTVQGAARHGRWVGVCGGLAGDPLGAALLAGLGVNELSMTPREIPAVKAVLRAHSMERLTSLAELALTFSRADQVRALAKELQTGA